jgi:hypothetical protein
VSDNRLEMLSPLTGVIMVVLMMAGALLASAFDYSPTTDRAVEIFSKNSNRVAIAGLVGAISAILLAWFAGSVFSALHEREGGTGRLSMIAFGGCVFCAIGMALGYMVIYAAGARAGRPGGVSPEQAVMMYDLYTAILGGVVSVGLAVFIGAAGAVSLRTQLFPTWLGWASVVFAIGLLTPLNYIFEGLALIWVVVVSIRLYRPGTYMRASLETLT